MSGTAIGRNRQEKLETGNCLSRDADAEERGGKESSVCSRRLTQYMLPKSYRRNQPRSFKMPSRARTIFILASLLLTFVVQSSAKADTLLGTAVTGQLIFTDLNVNYFDPANFLVPSSGYGNSVSPVNVTIVNPGIEFGIDDGSNRDTADFTGSTLTVTDLCLDSNCSKDIPFTMFFTDTAFTSITKVSDTFGSGGLTYSLTGDIIELDWAGFPASFPINTSEQAVFNLASAPVDTPEPSSVLLVGVAILGLAALAVKKIS